MADETAIPPQPVSLNVVNELTYARQQALQCLLDGDYAGARIKANFCLLIIATIPDGQLAGLSSQTWNRPGIVLFLDQLDKMEDAAATTDPGGMIVQGYEYSGIRGGSC